MWARSSRDSATLALGLGLVLGGCKSHANEGPGNRAGEPLRVAAASDLSVAFTEVGAAFEQKTGKHVDFTFGSSGMLATQIEQGAPFDVFAAADTSFIDQTVRAGSCVGETKALYARGQVVVYAKDPALLPKTLADLKDPKYAKIAIANPEHAPYGRAARQALTKSGVWDVVQPRMVYGENVQQTLMFARSGNADVALVAHSLAVASPSNYVPVDPTLHDPLDQAVVACKGGPKGPKTNEARAFIDFMGSEPGRAIMKKYGFNLPNDGFR
jgi:molybdate transport system substrate-binding protein